MGLKDLIAKHENVGGNFKDDWGWFSLKDDGDTAVVRFLMKNEEDILKFTKEVHRVPVNEYTNKILCSGADCEFCKNGENSSLRIMIPVFNVDEGKLQFWERGLNDIKELMNLIEEYGNLDSRDYKIKRNGKKNSTSTSYSYFPKDVKKLPKLEEYKEQIPNILGTNFKYILDLTPTQQREVIETGKISFKKEITDTTVNDNDGDGIEVF